MMVESSCCILFHQWDIKKWRNSSCSQWPNQIWLQKIKCCKAEFGTAAEDVESAQIIEKVSNFHPTLTPCRNRTRGATTSSDVPTAEDPYLHLHFFLQLLQFHPHQRGSEGLPRQNPVKLTTLGLLVRCTSSHRLCAWPKLTG